MKIKAFITVHHEIKHLTANLNIPPRRAPPSCASLSRSPPDLVMPKVPAATGAARLNRPRDGPGFEKRRLRTTIPVTFKGAAVIPCAQAPVPSTKVLATVVAHGTTLFPLRCSDNKQTQRASIVRVIRLPTLSDSIVPALSALQI